jgi:hypothetical protein
MRTGVIVYVTGDDTKFRQETERAVRSLPIEADMLEIVSTRFGQHDVSYAWWSLLVRGMQRIVCVIAEVTQAGKVRLTGRSLRLYG